MASMSKPIALSKGTRAVLAICLVLAGLGLGWFVATLPLLTIVGIVVCFVLAVVPLAIVLYSVLSGRITSTKQ